jgi:hypothetical protein
MLAVAEAYKIARAAVGGGHDWEVARGGRAVYTASGHSHTWNLELQLAPMLNARWRCCLAAAAVPACRHGGESNAGVSS